MFWLLFFPGQQQYSIVEEADRDPRQVELAQLGIATFGQVGPFETEAEAEQAKNQLKKVA